MGRVRKNHSPSIPTHILRHFQLQAKSDKTFRAYSISAGISPMTFYGWRKKYGKHFDAEVKIQLPGPTLPKEAVFTTFPTHLLQNSTDNPLLDIEFNDSLKFRLYRGATAQWFAPFCKLFRDGDSVC